MPIALLGAIALLAMTIPVFGQASITRPTATLTLVRNDDGTGTPAARHWAVYGDVTSRGYAGIYAFGVDLVDGSIATIRNVSPTGAFVSSSDPDLRRPIGFNAIRAALADKAKFYAA